jgi:hypothetical protein
VKRIVAEPAMSLSSCSTSRATFAGTPAGRQRRPSSAASQPGRGGCGPAQARADIRTSAVERKLQRSASAASRRAAPADRTARAARVRRCRSRWEQRLPHCATGQAPWHLEAAARAHVHVDVAGGPKGISKAFETSSSNSIGRGHAGRNAARPRSCRAAALRGQPAT